MSAIVTRSGVPLAAVLPEDVPADNFATMAATVLGALEVLYTAMKGPSPERTFVETEGGTLALRVITPKLFLVVLTPGRSADIQRAVDEAASRARTLLAKSA